jgi:hypothetical protein
MGYTITIGNAKPRFSKEDGYLEARWVVEDAASDDAPTFPHDELTKNTNSRSPSYSGWSEFCQEAGIYELFYHDYEGLIRPHPGCKLLQKEHWLLVQAALEKRRRVSDKLPGFEGWRGEDTGKYDYVLARLMWLEFWMRWALERCETPAIENT